MKILISAAETSSDAHGAELLKAIRSQVPQHISVQAFGIGGPKLQAAGLKSIVDARELLAMGFLEILSRLPRIFDAMKKVVQTAEQEKPDVAIVIDYPDFHIRLARKLKRLGVPVVYYIPPKVWAWRKSRIHQLRELFAKVLCILPFEEAFYEKEKVSVKYVGNPLADELPLALTREQARSQLGLQAQDKALILMPGSRPAELRRHLEIMLDSAVRAAAKLRASGFLRQQEQLKVLIPFPETASFEVQKARVDSWISAASGGHRPFILDIQVHQGNSAQCLVAADAGLIKSGTSTLEAALLGCPHAIVYKTNIVTKVIYRYFIRYPGPIGLVNLIAGNPKPYLVPEYLLEQAHVENLSKEVISLLSVPSRAGAMRKGLQSVREKVLGGQNQTSPSLNAAKEILTLCQPR